MVRSQLVLSATMWAFHIKAHVTQPAVLLAGGRYVPRDPKSTNMTALGAFCALVG